MPPPAPYQNPEQQTRDRIDGLLTAAWWPVQGKMDINFNAGPGIVGRECQIELGNSFSGQLVPPVSNGESTVALLERIHGENSHESAIRITRRNRKQGGITT